MENQTQKETMTPREAVGNLDTISKLAPITFNQQLIVRRSVQVLELFVEQHSSAGNGRIPTILPDEIRIPKGKKKTGAGKRNE